MKKIKILIVCGGVLDRGGISSYLMNYYRNIDKSELIFDFIVQGYSECLFINEINNGGGKLFQIPNKSRNLYQHLRKLYSIMKNGNYDIVHAHADAGNGLILKIAKIANIRVRISHSHSTNFYTKSKIKIILNKLQKKMIIHNATDLWGCSQAACKWLYGKKNSTIIRNAIETNRFDYSYDKYEQIKQSLCIENKKTICQVGHFSHIKNQMFTIKIIEKLETENINFKFYFIGEGDMEELNKVKEYVLNNKIRNVIFLGSRDDVPTLFQGMDLLVMPSLFEGFPVTLVEAQASGLKCIVSNSITKEVKIVDELIEFLPITDESISLWVKTIVNSFDYERISRIEKVKEMNYDIKIEAQKLKEKYISVISGVCNE
ncbi:glycosyltransferase [Thomasclavelia cocleata]|uniref:glycosyltransferase n=1 Tax=Thomasclavelia cocleata TaxID=69824 RepID=UPI002430F34E|nr:glycosyltransferase [Thomasclavelia cocleata]